MAAQVSWELGSARASIGEARDGGQRAARRRRQQARTFATVALACAPSRRRAERLGCVDWDPGLGHGPAVHARGTGVSQNNGTRSGPQRGGADLMVIAVATRLS